MWDRKNDEDEDKNKYADLSDDPDAPKYITSFSSFSPLANIWNAERLLVQNRGRRKTRPISTRMETRQNGKSGI
jgi:hypothetical protein